MQQRAAGLIGYAIEAAEGYVGMVTDVLFDDSNWMLRWFVVNTGPWLIGRKILIRPSELRTPFAKSQVFTTALTRIQVEACPSIGSDEPVSGQMLHSTSSYYGFGDTNNGAYFAWEQFGLAQGIMPCGPHSQTYGEAPGGDPHLRSIAKIKGYRIHALDGDIGHVEDFLLEDANWKIVYCLVNTRNWSFGKHVLISAAEIKDISWGEQNIRVELTCRNIRDSPSWTEPV